MGPVTAIASPVLPLPPSWGCMKTGRNQTGQPYLHEASKACHELVSLQEGLCERCKCKKAAPDSTALCGSVHRIDTVHLLSTMAVAC